MSSNAKKVSELTIQDLANYLRLSEITPADEELLDSILEAAKAYVLKYTGLTETQVDAALDITIAVYVLCSDMYDNRSYYVDTTNVNQVVEGILSLHSVNLL